MTGSSAVDIWRKRSPRLSRDRHINCDRPSLPAAGKHQSQEVEVVFEEDSGGKSLALREFSNDTIGSALKRFRETFSTSAIHADNNAMEVRSDPVESAKSNLFD